MIRQPRCNITRRKAADDRRAKMYRSPKWTTRWNAHRPGRANRGPGWKCLPSGRLPAGSTRGVAGFPHSRAVRQRPLVPGRFHRHLEGTRGEASGRACRFDDQVSGLGHQIQKSGCRTDTSASGSILVAPELRRATWTYSPPRRHRTSTTASSGTGYSPGAMEKPVSSGSSYYAMNQRQVAALNPPHLTAICP